MNPRFIQGILFAMVFIFLFVVLLNVPYLGFVGFLVYIPLLYLFIDS